MIERENSPERADKVTWTVTALCVAGSLVIMAMIGMVELGAVAHDAFCPDHGWAA